MIERYELVLMAERNQIHIADVDHPTGDGWVWTEEKGGMLTLGPGIVAFGTARDTETMVLIEIHAFDPTVDLEGWNQVAECTLETRGGRVMVTGTGDLRADTFTVQAPSRTMRVRIFWSGLDQVLDGALQGDDHYVVQMWPDEPRGAELLKEWPEGR